MEQQNVPHFCVLSLLCSVVVFISPHSGVFQMFCRAIASIYGFTFSKVFLLLLKLIILWKYSRQGKVLTPASSARKLIKMHSYSYKITVSQDIPGASLKYGSSYDGRWSPRLKRSEHVCNKTTGGFRACNNWVGACNLCRRSDWRT